jgi:hypothetical protein
MVFASIRSRAARAENFCEVFHPAMVLRRAGKRQVGTYPFRALDVGRLLGPLLQLPSEPAIASARRGAIEETCGFDP